jgi:phosphatidylglycerophosphatase A
MIDKKRFSLSTIIATFFGAGFFPFAPGTFGSLLAFPLYALITYLMIISLGGVHSLATAELINSILVFITALFLIGIWASNEYCKNYEKKDPKEIVIDEVVGQLLTICLILFMLRFIGAESIMKVNKLGISDFQFVIYNLISAFVMFRICDIIKPWPISYLDKNIKAGLGIMIDDIAAAFFAVLFHFFILFAIIDMM